MLTLLLVEVFFGCVNSTRIVGVEKVKPSAARVKKPSFSLTTVVATCAVPADVTTLTFASTGAE
ncbi:MAG: hypothetical protein ACKO29_00955, partial [Actinomycetota bacterium]